MSGDGTTDRGPKPPRTLFSLGRPGSKGATADSPTEVDEPTSGESEQVVTSVDAVELACGACGQTLMPGAAFCGECGTPVAALDDEPFDLVEEVPMADLDDAELGEYVEELEIADAPATLYADAPPPAEGPGLPVATGADQSNESGAAVLMPPAAVLYADPTRTEPLPTPTGTFAISPPTFGSADSTIDGAEADDVAVADDVVTDTDDDIAATSEPDDAGDDDDAPTDGDHVGVIGVAGAGAVAGAVLADPGSSDAPSASDLADADVVQPDGVESEVVADADADAEVDSEVDVAAGSDAEVAAGMEPEPTTAPTEPVVPAPAAAAAAAAGSGAGSGTAVAAGSYGSPPPATSSSKTGLLVGVAAAVVVVLVVAGVLIASGGDKDGSLDTAQQPTTTAVTTTSTSQASSTTDAPATTEGPTTSTPATTADTAPVESTAPTTAPPVTTAVPTTPRPTVAPPPPPPTAPPSGRITSNPSSGGRIDIPKGGTGYITLQNVGGAAAGCALTGSAGLTVSQNCSPSMAPGATVVVSVTVSPTWEGGATVSGVLEGSGSYVLNVFVPNS